VNKDYVLLKWEVEMVLWEWKMDLLWSESGAVLQTGKDPGTEKH
jgi:hypothetical protein